MPTGTLKETLLFGDDIGAVSHRYEIYKSDSQGGYFAMIYTLKSLRAEHHVIMAWNMEETRLPLRSSYIPNARMECEAHWKKSFRAGRRKGIESRVT
ncbi:hypothetical protein [Lonsdalea populi]|uniref:hypothetical protein n=1 Tax=Lonsdalea populi TaxID=1172565 RepID=UPI000A253320|nr:hypothetical protein [Lonsdalea populi]OSM99422.1 hypothetical protein AU508_00025 [Lonsdalea populi]RAT68253.1 hypothetical protein AU505_15245 [Lonsdalea populi]RAT71374.1 hypothetical protein AU504_05505 [Lonsdalea populi]RAT76562.1 hypothetical protein AU506_05070 [Lonsdalea populi]RAT77685.1 hypothetical protein AU507_11335 [Lonsdalea populi]